MNNIRDSACEIVWNTTLWKVSSQRWTIPSPSLSSRSENCRNYQRKDEKILIQLLLEVFLLRLFICMPIVVDSDCIWLHQRHWTEQEWANEHPGPTEVKPWHLDLLLVNSPHTWHFVVKKFPPLSLKLLSNALAMLSETEGRTSAGFKNGSSTFLYISANDKRRHILPRACKVSSDTIYLKYFFNTSSLCLGHPPHCRRVLPLPPAQRD